MKQDDSGKRAEFFSGVELGSDPQLGFLGEFHLNYLSFIFLSTKRGGGAVCGILWRSSG